MGSRVRAQVQQEATGREAKGSVPIYFIARNRFFFFLVLMGTRENRYQPANAGLGCEIHLEGSLNGRRSNHCELQSLCLAVTLGHLVLICVV